MWWPPDKEKTSSIAPDGDFDKDTWAKNEETGWMIILIGSSIILWIWEFINFRLYNVLFITIFIAILSGIWKSGVIQELYTNGVWILITILSIPFIPLIELYIYITNRD